MPDTTKTSTVGVRVTSPAARGIRIDSGLGGARGSARFIGRVGALAVALGVGVAVATNAGLARADTTSSDSSDSGSAQSSTGAARPGDPKPSGTSTADEPSADSAPTQSGAKDADSAQSQATTVPKMNVSSSGGALTSGVDDDKAEPAVVAVTPKPVSAEPDPTAEPKVAPAEAASDHSTPAPTPTPTPVPAPAVAPESSASKTDAVPVTPKAAVVVHSVQAPTETITARVAAAVPVDSVKTVDVQTSSAVTAIVSAVVAPPPAPNAVQVLLAIPTAIVNVATTFAAALLAPFFVPGPGAPAEPPLLWAVLAWVRRQVEHTFFNATPTMAPQIVNVALNDTADSAPITLTGGLDGDPEDALAYTVGNSGIGSHGGTLTSVSGAGFTYAPDANWDGATPYTDTFTVTASDAADGFHIHGLLGLLTLGAYGHTATGTVTVNVDASTIYPPAVTDPAWTLSATLPGDSVGTVRGHVNATDPKGLPITFGSTTDPGAEGTLTVATDGTFAYVPSAQARHDAAADDAATTGADSFSFDVTVTNSRGGATTTAVTLAIAPTTNQDPSAPTPPNGTTTDPVTGAVTGNLGWTDQDGDVITYTGSVTGKSTSGGDVVVNADGSFTYTPTKEQRHAVTAPGAPDGVAADSFDVTVDDGHGSLTTTTVSVTILGSNENPTAATTFGSPDALGVITGSIGGVDADGDTLYYALTSGPTHGTVNVNSVTGAFTYTPAPLQRLVAYNTAATDYDPFTVTITDGRGGATVVNVANVPIDPTRAVVTSTQSVLGTSASTPEFVTGADGTIAYSTRMGTGTAGNPYRTVLTVIAPDGTTRTLTVFGGVPSGTFAKPVVGPTGIVALVTTQTFSNGDQDTSVATIRPAGGSASEVTSAYTGTPIGTAVIGPDGTVYVQIDRGTTSTDTALLAIPATGPKRDTLTSGSIGDPVGGVVAGPNGIAYQTFVKYGSQVFTTIVRTDTSHVPITAQAEGPPVGGLVVGKDGTAAQTIDRSSIAGATEYAGLVVFNPDGSSYQYTQAGTAHASFSTPVVQDDGLVGLLTFRGTADGFENIFRYYDGTSAVYSYLVNLGPPIGQPVLVPGGAGVGFAFGANNGHVVYLYESLVGGGSAPGASYANRGVVVGPDGTAVLAAYGTDGNSPQKTYLLTMRGNHYGTANIDGVPIGPAVVGVNGTAALASSVAATANSPALTNLVVVGASTFIPSTFSFSGTAKGGPIVSDDGTVFQTTATGAGTVANPFITTVHVIRNGADAAVQIVGLTSTGVTTADDGTAYLTTTAGNRTTVTVFHPDGATTTVAIPAGTSISTFGQFGAAQDGRYYLWGTGSGGYTITEVQLADDIV